MLPSVAIPAWPEGVMQTSYDIIKAHGGELKVAKIEGQVCVFNIQIPIN